MTKVPVTFRLSRDNRIGVEQAAKEMGCTAADVIRMAIDDFTGRTPLSAERTVNRARILAELQSLDEDDLSMILKQLKRSAAE